MASRLMLRSIYGLLFIVCISYMLLGHANGRAFSKNAGNTGAPGDETLGNGDPKTCIACHATDNSVEVSIDIDLIHDGQVVSEYIPNQIHTVKLSINTLMGNPVRWGFQMVALANDGWEDTASWIQPGGGVRFATANSTGRLYAEHVFPLDTNVFDIKWRAPDVGTDSVSFFASGNGVNLSTTTAGDAADAAVISVGEGTPLSIGKEPILKNLFYPSITNGLIKLDNPSRSPVRIFNLEGVRLLDFTAESSTFDLSILPKGIYILTTVVPPNRHYAQRVIKI